MSALVLLEQRRFTLAFPQTNTTFNIGTNISISMSWAQDLRYPGFDCKSFSSNPGSISNKLIHSIVDWENCIAFTEAILPQNTQCEDNWQRRQTCSAMALLSLSSSVVAPTSTYISNHMLSICLTGYVSCIPPELNTPFIFHYVSKSFINQYIPSQIDWLNSLLHHQAWQLYEENQLTDLLDPAISWSQDTLEESLRVVEMALLCTHSRTTLRPTMTTVVSILTGGSEVAIPKFARFDVRNYSDLDFKFSGSQANSSKQTDSRIRSYSSHGGDSTCSNNTSGVVSILEPR